MMTRERELLQQALDALTNCLSEHGHRCNRCDSEIDEGGKLIAALREALAAPQAEPVAWYLPSPDGDDSIFRDHRTVVACTGNKWEGFLPLYAAPPAAPAPAAPDGWVMVPMEPTPEMLAVVRNGPMHETWTEGYCAMIAASPAAPVVPLTDEQILSMWKSSEFRGKGGQADWFCEGIRAAEAHHGITGGSK